MATSETDPLNRVTAWSYTTSPGGNGTTVVTDPLGYPTSDTLTAGQLTSEVDAAGTSAAVTTTYSYDPTSGGVAQKTTAAGTSQAETTKTTYVGAGNVAAVTDPDLQTSTNTYTAQNLIHTATKPSQACTQYSYPAGSSSPGEIDQYSGLCPANGGTGGARSAMVLSYGSQPSNPTQVASNGQPATIYTYDG